MYWRYTQEQLWGYAPLFLYLTLYGGVMLLLTFRRDGSYRASNRYSILTGMLLGFGFPGLLPLPVLLLVAFVPLWALHRKLVDEGAGYGRVWAHGFNAFLLYNILATYWVTNTSLGAGLFAILANSFLMTLPWLVFHWTSRRSPRVAYLAFAAAWLSFEYGHHNWPLNWPWLTLGNGFMQWPSLVQWYEVTGALGGSAWVLGCNYLAYRLYTAPASAPRRHLVLLTAIVVLVPLLGSLLRYYTYSPGETGRVSVAVIQPNFEPHFEKFSGNQRAQLDTFRRLSQAALAAGPVDYLVYPETSFGRVNEDEPLDSPPLRALREELAGSGLRYLVTGIDAYHIFGPGESWTDAARPFPNGGGAFEALNAAVQINLADETVQTYRKGVFVPGAESFPFRRVFFFLEGFVNSLGGTVAGRGTQERRLPLVGESARIAPVICYESVFGEYFTGYIDEGAQAAFVMTNDGWWSNTGGFRQHLWLSSLRAIETRRDVVRSANVGACAFIDQRGKILSRTRYDEAGFLRGEVRLNDARTLYVRWGDIIPRIALLLTVMVVLGNVARSLRNRRPGSGR